MKRYMVSCFISVVWLLTVSFGIQAADDPLPSRQSLPKTTINPKDGATMVLIPAGAFQMGTSQDEYTKWKQITPQPLQQSLARELPQHTVELDAYYMYATEVTVAQYRKFCKETGHHMPNNPSWVRLQRETCPIVRVSWADAKAYADWAGAKLPTEAQWEKAARGGDQRMYAWDGNWPPPTKAGNFADLTYKQYEPNATTILDKYQDGYPYTSPVGSFTANPLGLYDLGGNVIEWCADYNTGEDYSKAQAKNPTGPSAGYFRSIRGSSWGDDTQYSLHVARRAFFNPDETAPYIGFRCVVTAALR